MTRPTRKTLVITAALLACAAPAAPARAQSAAAPGDTARVPAEAVRADLRHLYETLQEAHYDLYVHRPRAEYDRLFAEMTASIREPMTRFEYVRLFQRFLAYGRVGHARMDAPVTDFVGRLQQGGRMLPLFVRVDDGRVRLTRPAEITGVLRPGDEIVAIDGRPVAEWLERLGAYVSGERPYMVHAQMENLFPILLWMELGDVDAVQVTARGASGEQTARVEALDGAGRAAVSTAHPVPALETDFDARHFEILPNGIGYLRPGPFFNLEAQSGPAPSYESSRFRAFVDSAFHAVLDSGAGDLIIDLRNNPGGDNSFSDPMVAWFADRPFRFVSSFMLKASAATKAHYARQRESGQAIDDVLARLMENEAAQPNGARYPFAIEMVEPRAEPRYRGRVYVLVNRHSYSNATAVAAMVQDYEFGTVLGEETADLPTSHASVVYFDLPNTGLTVTYPKSYFVRPSGDESLRGVVPDHALPPPAIGSGEDDVLDAAVRHVKAQRTGATT